MSRENGRNIAKVVKGKLTKKKNKIKRNRENDSEKKKYIEKRREKQ